MRRIKKEARYCQFCGMIFFISLTNKKTKNQRWCSEECRNKKHYKFVKNGDCIECVSHFYGDNCKHDIVHYPQITINGQSIGMHRHVYNKAYRGIPKDKIVMHKCDNPKCVNVNHLELGTHEDNQKDKVKRGRSLTGEKNHQSKLTDAIVREIRADKTSSSSELAKKYGVSVTILNFARRGINWKHVI